MVPSLATRILYEFRQYHPHLGCIHLNEKLIQQEAQIRCFQTTSYTFRNLIAGIVHNRKGTLLSTQYLFASWLVIKQMLLHAANDR